MALMLGDKGSGGAVVGEGGTTQRTRYTGREDTDMHIDRYTHYISCILLYTHVFLHTQRDRTQLTGHTYRGHLLLVGRAKKKKTV
jgi:hypothetical protein